MIDQRLQHQESTHDCGQGQRQVCCRRMRIVHAPIGSLEAMETPYGPDSTSNDTFKFHEKILYLVNSACQRPFA